MPNEHMYNPQIVRTLFHIFNYIEIESEDPKHDYFKIKGTDIGNRGRIQFDCVSTQFDHAYVCELADHMGIDSDKFIAEYENITKLIKQNLQSTDNT